MRIDVVRLGGGGLAGRHRAHRGEAAEGMRAQFESDGGWMGLLRLYADAVR